eukprot:403339175
MNLQNYQTVKVNNPKSRDQINEPQSNSTKQQPSRINEQIYPIPSNQSKQVRHVSKSPIASHSNWQQQQQSLGFGQYHKQHSQMQPQQQLIDSESQYLGLRIPQNQQNINLGGAQQNFSGQIQHGEDNGDMNNTLYRQQFKQQMHQRYQSQAQGSFDNPIMPQNQANQKHAKQYGSQQRNIPNNAQVSSSYNQFPFRQAQQHSLLVDSDEEDPNYALRQNSQQFARINNRVPQDDAQIYIQQQQQFNKSGHKRVIQSLDFNTLSEGQRMGLLVNQGHQPHYKQQYSKPNVQKRDLSPIWGPDLKNQPQRDNFIDEIYQRDYNTQNYQNQGQSNNDEQFNNDIILTESDVSHQSSFYELPDDRKQQLHKTNRIIEQKQQQIQNQNQNLHYNNQYNQSAIDQQQVPGNQAYNSLLKQFQQTSSIPQQKQIKQSKTSKVSPRQNLQQQQYIQNMKINQQSTNISTKDYEQEDFINKDSLTTRILPPQQYERQVTVKAQTTVQSQIKSQETQLSQQVKIVYQMTEDQRKEYAVMQAAVNQTSYQNIKLQTELEAFKLLSRSLMKQNKSLKLSMIDEKAKTKNISLYQAKIRELEIQKLQLQMQNFTLINKLQKTQDFLLKYANNQIDQEDEEQDDFQFIEQLIHENSNLRGLLQVQSDMDQIQQELQLQENQLWDQNYDSELKSSLTLSTMESSAVQDMIQKASKHIKENAKKRKEEDEANFAASTTGFSLDGKPEQFPFKNIKPKKAFLLGGPISSDTEETQPSNGSSPNKEEDGQVNLSSPDH